jgi:uncharacterized phage infection (PIP) family protein YhgE
MSDIQSKLEQVKSKESFLEKIARFIPGYKGYVDRDNSRELDTLLRNTLAKALESNKVKFKNTILSLSQRGKLFETDGIDKLEKKLDTSAAKLRAASRGFSGAFDVVKVKEEKLNQLYAFDESLVSYINEIEASCTELENNAKSNTDINAVKDKISQQLDALINKFTERENLLRSL